MSAAAGSRDRVRVIVVGPGVLESGLFAEPRLRVVRAVSIFDAIGTLCDPAEPDYGRATIVVVSSEVEAMDSPELFTRGLRMADPEVKVLRAAREGDARGDALRLGYDGGVTRSTAAPEVQRLADQMRASGATAAAPTGAPAAPAGSGGAATSGGSVAAAAGPTGPRVPPAGQAPIPATAPDIASSPAALPVGAPDPSDPPDVQLIHLVITGRGVLETALGFARRRLGRDELRFVPEAQPVRADAQTAVAEVRANGEKFGSLVLPPAAGAGGGATQAVREAMRVEAKRLGAWLRLERQHTTLRAEALRDPLTRAWNRRYFDEALAATLAESDRVRQPVTLMVFDIDGFKSFNDRFGHPQGDKILIEAVRLLNSIVRPTDRVCRIGGDEFAVIFFDPQGPRKPGTHPLTCREMAERFQREVNAQKFPELGINAPGALTISAGLATYPWDAKTATDLVAAADRFALESKQSGKKRITIGRGAETPKR